MNLTELTDARLIGLDWRWVRWELFVFHDVRDVLAGPRPGTVVVVHRGEPRTDDWIAALEAAGIGDDRPAPRPAA